MAIETVEVEVPGMQGPKGDTGEKGEKGDKGDPRVVVGTSSSPDTSGWDDGTLYLQVEE